MIKRALSALLAAAMLLGVTACSNNNTSNSGGGEGGDENAPVTIRFWNGWTGPDGDKLTELVNQYNEKNTDNVTIQMDIMEFASLGEKLTTSLASNTNPELHLGFANGEYSYDGSYIPIDDIFEKTNLDKDDFIEDILDDCYVGDHLMGIPFQISSLYLFWNKDLFKEAGLDPDTPPKTWEELFEFSRKIDNPEKNIVGGGLSYNDAVAVCTGMMVGNGGGVVDDDFNCILDDPKYIDANKKALEWVKAFYDERETNRYISEYETMFQAGTCGMLTQGAWELATLEQNGINYGVSLLPAGDVQIAQNAFPVSLCVMKNTEGRELDAAYSFINYWNNNTDNPITEKGDSPAYHWTKDMGYQAYLKSVVNDEELQKDPDYQITSQYAEHLHLAYPGTFVYGNSMQTDVLVPMLEAVATGQKSIDEGIADAAEGVREYLQKQKDLEAKLK